MLEFFAEHPGRLYVAATLLPLVPAVLILLIGTVRNLTRPYADVPGIAGWLYARLNHPRVELAGAWLSIGVMGLVSFIAVYGFTTLLYEHYLPRLSGEPIAPWNLDDTRLWNVNADGGQIDWIRFGSTPVPDAELDIIKAHSIHLGYWIEIDTTVMFAMVAVVGTMIYVFSLGYMRNELKSTTIDETLQHARRGRFGRFYLYLNLFVIAMFNLIIADNLLQVFISWELVGVCSYFLISYYYERREAGWAANKAFIANRIGDVGFLIAIAISWSTCNTFMIGALGAEMPWHGALEPLFSPTMRTLLGLGLFLGCVGKSAQFPLQVWLPDAMAGPTPVSALIHAATMVAAGVYLVARCYPLFTPDALLVIAYTGCITLLIGGTVACVQTDIKKVLAYSTVSQLGYMMLALGVGGWAAGVFHLLTHAFFKALLFLGAGSVIHGLHHEQDLRKMGGLRRKMPVTAWTMFIGVLAISGFPLLSGWYSKEAILTAAATFGVAAPSHVVLAVVPFLVAGLTAFYMFRLWFLTFAGEPRDRHVYDHAHESPLVMTIPLIILAMFSIAVGWGWPAWEPEASFLYELLNHQHWPSSHFWDDPQDPLLNAATLLHEYHLLLELIAGAIGLFGFAVAYWRYVLRTPRFHATNTEPRGFLGQAWYFDAVYDACLRKPTQNLAVFTAAFDKQSSDHGAPRSLDGLLNGIGQLAANTGRGLRGIQNGQVRGYVTILGLTVVGLLGMLAVLTR
ncbi:MAG: NADH-quinone oxidoreductase subunit L [Bacteroidales bacterium]|nr:NADH-quinone oxidoreductase subunit L [Bacteroidales bacterium]